MTIAYSLQARVRGKSDAIADANQGEEVPLCVNPRGDILIARGMPGISELVRMRQSYMAIVATAVAPVTALPTTTAQMTLWNGEQENGKIYVLDSVGVFVTVSAAAATAVGLCALMNIGKKTAPTSALTPRGLAGQAYRGTGIVAVGATVTNDVWITMGSSNVGPTSQIGQTLDWSLNGQYVVPPGHMFSLSAIANTGTTITCRCFMRWHEVLLPVG